MRLLPFASVSLFPCSFVLAASRTDPPSGAVVVPDDYSTIQAAVDSLGDSEDAVIFIYGGTYNEQVYIERNGALTIYGETEDTSDYKGNKVTITNSLDASAAGSNDASGTLRVHSDNVAIYNIDIVNSYGKGSQAIAVSQYGSQVGFYGCGLYGYQDTLLANVGTQVYLKSYIEGATDFIFGQQAQAYFGGNTLAVSGKGWITAHGRQSDDDGSYVFNKNTIVLADGADSNTEGNFYLGRPWREYAKVIFMNTDVQAKINPALWSIWNEGDERTGHVTFADYATTGSGISSISRPSFATELSSESYSISTAVGSDYANWVDAEYFV
ncbi:carbohydrate esterase family 8 protein [Schizophyllum commune H4-8]|uniref:Pectinesterase n=1 Tax=Schizophyllum commune (strain H4-8 / FGSC 9210) TaxID=578458 RepID=D8PYT0_SCHCM|nr:carbohydrate esterase family 8 protein [Schizophyllum commune H4-8]KAI5896093.1 carbohydrate esterase family 8 protein [Schizophyllum commune H4-8]